MKNFKGLLWFVLFFIILEAFIFRNPNLYGLVPKSFIGQIIDLEKRFEAQDPKQIEWIILGDSQAMDAVRPPLIAEQLGVDADHLFNFSISGGKPVNELHLLQKNLSKLNNLKGVLIVVSEHQFNNIELNKDIKFRYDASLKERFQAPNIDERSDLLLGWISYGFGLRDVWWQIGKEAWEKKIPLNESTKPKEEKYEYPWGLDPVPWSAPEYRTKEYAIETADRWLKNFEMNGPHTKAFLATIDLLEKNHIPWVIVQLPRTNLIEEAIKQHYPNEQKDYYHFIEETAEKYNKEFTNEFPTLPNDAFRDVNHVNEKGAKLLTPSLAKIIINLK